MADLVSEVPHDSALSLAAPPTRLAESPAPGGDACVHELVLANARLRPDAVALASGDSVLTYAALARRACRLAARLRALGVGPDVPVGLCMDRSPELAVGALAILSAGGAYVAMDVSYPEERLAFMVADSAAPVVLTRRPLVPRLRGCAAALVALDDPDAASEEGGDLKRDDPPRVSPGSLAYVIYTSGSTGTPKGVMIEHGSLANLVRWYIKAFGVTAADRASQMASPGFDATVLELWPYLVAGASVRFPADAIRTDVPALLDWLCQERITIGFLPTPLAEVALDLPWPETTTLRLLLTGGDMLHKHPRADLPFVLVNNYGPTENTVIATSGIVPAVDADLAAAPAPRPPSIGRPIPGCRAVVVDGELRRVAPGSPGELLLGGPGLARGYLNRPELTASRFVEDPLAGEPGGRLYRTGDLVRELPDGELEFLGRLDDQVKIRGYRIEPAEIAAALDRHPDVAGSAVTAPERPNGERRLVAYVVPGGHRPEPDELRRHLERLLPAYMVPAAFVYLSELPLTPNGKVDRAALPRPPAAERTAAGAPRSELEREIGVVVAELLGLEQVCVDQEFFELGGHSLMAAQLVARIRDRYAVDIALISIFQAGTVAGLAAAVEHLVKTGEDPFAAVGAPLDVLAQRSGTRPVLFFIVSDESGLTALHHFIRALGEDQPVVGLVPPRRNRRFERDVDVTGLAERQVAAIRQRQPHGPYCLCGHSLGGLLAYEAAGQLRDQGEQVAWVGLIDTMVPAASRAVLARQRRLSERLRRLRSRAGTIGLAATLRETGKRRADRLRASLGLPLSPDQFDHPGADMLTVGYRVVGHDAPLDVFGTSAGRQKAGSSAMGWEGLHRGPLQWHPVSGDHHTVLHQPATEAVQLFARRLFEAQGRWAAEGR